MKIHKKHIYALVIFSIQFLFLIAKSNLGAYTPDEMLYTTGEYHRGNLVLNEMPFKFYVTYIIISYLYNINQYLFPLIQFVITFILFVYIYEENKKHFILHKYVLLLFFLLPSAIYFSSAYLRDYLIYLSSIFLIFSYRINGINKRTIVGFLIMSILRYEAGIIILTSYLLTKINHNVKTFAVNWKSTPFILILLVVSLAILINIDMIWDALYIRLSSNLNEGYIGFSIWHFEPTKFNILAYSLLNWFAYFTPYLFQEDYSLFSYFMLLESIIVGILFIRGFFIMKSSSFKKDSLYQISFFILIATFYLSILEVAPETIFRHRMPYVPFLMYLNFAKSFVTSKRDALARLK